MSILCGALGVACVVLLVLILVEDYWRSYWKEGCKSRDDFQRSLELDNKRAWNEAHRLRVEVDARDRWIAHLTSELRRLGYVPEMGEKEEEVEE